jgi:hypothetical protein
MLSYSYFRGLNAETMYNDYCVKESRPLEKEMIHIGDKWYNNKFSDVKKTIYNCVLPKYLDILNKVTGFGQKSGLVENTSLNLTLTHLLYLTHSHVTSHTTILDLIRQQRKLLTWQTGNCIK